MIVNLRCPKPNCPEQWHGNDLGKLKTLYYDHLEQAHGRPKK